MQHRPTRRHAGPGAFHPRAVPFGYHPAENDGDNTLLQTHQRRLISLVPSSLSICTYLKKGKKEKKIDLYICSLLKNPVQPPLSLSPRVICFHPYDCTVYIIRYRISQFLVCYVQWIFFRPLFPQSSSSEMRKKNDPDIM